MTLQFLAEVDVDAPRDRVIASSVDTSLEHMQRFDPRVESVETNGVPDGAAGQVATVLAVTKGGRTTFTITTVESSLPDHVVERVEGDGPEQLIRTTFTALPDGGTRVAFDLTVLVPWWNPMRFLLRLVLPRTIRSTLASIKEFVESDEQPTTRGTEQ